METRNHYKNGAAPKSQTSRKKIKKNEMKKSIILSLFITASFLTAKAQFTKLLDFSDYATGKYPGGSLISDGTFLYGMASSGGINQVGVIFKIKPDGTGFSKLLDFAADTNGKNPNGDLISVGSYLYGITEYGGTGACSGGCGVIFKIKPDGTGYTKLLDFTGNVNGSSPKGSLISDGTFLYGMTYGGGANGKGVLFKIKPDGTGYAKLLDFTGTADGSSPWGSLFYDGIFLYGMTYGGGTNGQGVLFKIMPNGTGYSKLMDFGLSNQDGKHPFGSLISDGNFLYGMTQDGGTNAGGIIFKIKTDGTGYSKLFDFGGVNGALPTGSLISDGTLLYGMAGGGGGIFSIKPDGTGFTNLFTFTPSITGSNPHGSLLSAGSVLYGMTFQQGPLGYGTIFKYGLGTNNIAENNEVIGFNSYPNPSSGTFTIATKENSYGLIITNVLGKIVYQSEIKSQKSEIDLSKQPKGIYFLQVIDEKKNVSNKKIIIH